MRGVAYIRVSTKEQDETIQKKAIEEFAVKNGIEIIRYYVDKGESGSKPFRQRPEANRLLQEIDDLKPDVVIAWALDRLGRTMMDTVNTVNELESRGYKVITTKEEWLRTMDQGIRKLILAILSWVAEQERKRIRERQEEAWRQGKQKGRPPKVTDETIRRYLRRYQGLPMRSIWKIMRQDNHDISYTRFLERVKKILGVKNLYGARIQ